MGFERQRPTYRIGWAIELCWGLASMAFAVILMYAYPNGLRPVHEEVVIAFHDMYFVMSGAEYLLYHMLWAWAWVNTLRAIFTRLQVRRVNRFFIIAVTAHVLHLIYFLVLFLIVLARVDQEARPTMLLAYLGTGLAFWLAVLGFGVGRMLQRDPSDPS
jgi:hypothetical protein